MKDGNSIRSYMAYIRGEPDEIAQIESVFSDVFNANNWATRGEAIREIFLAGLESLSKDSSNPMIRSHSIVLQKMRQASAEEMFYKQLRELQAQIGSDDFSKFVEENKVPINGYIEWISLQDATAKKSEKHLIFLNTILSDGPMKVSEIRKVAVATGHIDEDDDDAWNYLCRLASRYHFTGGEYGTWRKP